MKVEHFTFNDFAVNTYIVYDPDSSYCAIIDPGMTDKTETARIVQFIDRMNLRPLHLINTHQHIDHVMGNDFVRDIYNITPSANRRDEFLGGRLREQAAMFGLRNTPDIVPVTTFLNDGDMISIGTGALKVLEVPGHSPGSIALYDAAGEFVITGDALFNTSIGRTDLPGGDFDILIHSIKTKLLTLPDSTVVLPGHGPSTTIGYEKRLNPYLMG